MLLFISCFLVLQRMRLSGTQMSVIGPHLLLGFYVFWLTIGRSLKTPFGELGKKRFLLISAKEPFWVCHWRLSFVRSGGLKKPLLSSHVWERDKAL